MKSLMTFLAAFFVMAGCATPLAPTRSPSPELLASPSPTSTAAIRCVYLPETEPDVCGKIVALVQETHPDEVRDASRILIADTCPPQVLCDRAFLYDTAVLVVPADGDSAKAIRLRVFGHQGQPFTIAVWSGPLPEHVVNLLAHG
jgi:hypothetical protein